MGSILTATVSVYLVMFLGLALATRGFVGESFWPAAQKLNYFVFLPVLFAHTLATAELGGLRVVGLILGVVVTLAIGGLAVGLWQNRTDGRHDLTPAVIEGALRANVPLGLTIAFVLAGSAGLTLFVVAAAIYLPSVVIIGAVAAERTARREDADAEGVYDDDEVETPLAAAARLLIRNPIIIGGAAGVALNITGAGLSGSVGSTMQAVGLAALPFGVLAAGAGIDLARAGAALETFRAQIQLALVVKLLALPVVAAIVGAVFGLDGLTYRTLILLAALPGVVPRFTAVRTEEDGQTVLAGVTNAAMVAAFVTLPLALWILG
jgi:predicted permease